MVLFDKTETFDKAVRMVADQIGKDPSEIHADSVLEGLGVDSLDMVELVMKFEEQFGMDVNDDDVEDLKNMQEIVDYVHARRSK